MKRLLFFIPAFFIFYSCSNQLTKEKAADLINLKYQYPIPVEMDINADYVIPISGQMAALGKFEGVQLSDKELATINGLADKRLVKINDKVMTGQDATGYDIINWHHCIGTLTDSGKKYSIVQEGIEVNKPKTLLRLRLYDQQLGEITSMVEKEPGKTYEVHFTTVRTTPTPFYDVYKSVYGASGLYDITKVEQGVETITKADGMWKVE